MSLLASTMSMFESVVWKKPLAVHRPKDRHAVQGMSCDPGLHRRSETVPSGKHQAALRPTEHPRNCAQVLDPHGARSRRGTATDIQAGDFADDRRRPEILL